MKNIGIHGRRINDASRPQVKDLFEILREKGLSVSVSKIFKSENTDLLESDFNLFDKSDASKIDAVLSLGGDGTILDTLTLVGNNETPILGINTGRLGFLATIAKDQIPLAMDLLFDGKFTIDKRALLKLSTKENFFGDEAFALNEFSILRRETASMIVVKAFLDGKYINTYWADGLMVATPTGSTGYSLSCGGPILLPHTKNFLITPVSPHNLNIRPLIVPEESELTFEVESRNANYLISMDSRSTPVAGDTKLKITKAPFYANLIKIEGDNFIDTLKNKLSWGLDKRN